MNAFADYAEAATPVWRRKRDVANAKRSATLQRKSELEAKLDERDDLARGYRLWCKEKREAILVGPHGTDVRGIIRFVRTMTSESAGTLVEMIDRAAWLRNAPEDVKQEVLLIVRRGIGKVLGNQGYDPHDMHAIWGEEPRAADLVQASIYGLDPYFGGVRP